MLLKKSISFVLVLAVALLSLPLVGLQVANAANWEDILYYEIMSNGTEIEVVCCDDSVSGEFIIPDKIDGIPVTRIGDEAFTGCCSLERIIIPNSVTSIGSSAFAMCESLTEVIIGNSVVSFGDWSFLECHRLASIIIPDSTIDIGEGAFSWCCSLESITIPNSVTSIGDGAFDRCNLLTVYCSKDSFAHNYADENGINYEFMNVDDNFPFTYEKLNNTEIVITSCDRNVQGELIIPDEIDGLPVTGIGDYAFEWCSLTSIVIPHSVTNIGNSAFSGCTSLASIIIPDGVISIGEWAFYNCYSLTSITIPDSVTSIGQNAFSNSSYFDNLSNWENDVLYIGDHLIAAGQNIEGSYTINSGTKCVANTAFQMCNSLTSIIIPNSVTSIGKAAFAQCSSLESIEIPNSVTRIEDDTFYGCHSLANIILPNSIVSIGVTAFAECLSLENIIIPNSVVNIGFAAFVGCTSLTNITLSSSMTSIEDGLFAGCSSLVSVIIPKSVTSIGVSAFVECSSLKNIKIPSSVETIGDYAFTNCPLLQSVFVPLSAANIGELAFGYILDDYGVPHFVPDFVLFCHEGSAAKDYAAENSLVYFASKASTNLDVNDGYLFVWSKQGFTAKSLLSQFANDNLDLYKNGSKVPENDPSGTGCEIRFLHPDSSYYSIEVVFPGDVNGDSVVDSADLFLVNNVVNTHSTLEGAYYTAANLDLSDFDLTIADYQMIENIALGKA